MSFFIDRRYTMTGKLSFKERAKIVARHDVERSVRLGESKDTLIKAKNTPGFESQK